MKPFFIAVCAAALAITCLWRASAETPRFCEGCNYAGAALANSDFTNGVLIGTNFEKATLSSSSFRGTRLSVVNFEKADLRGAHSYSADCVACKFGGALLDGSSFSNVRMVAATFKGFSSSVEADLRGTNFAGAVLCWHQVADAQRVAACDPMHDAITTGANFSNAHLCDNPLGRIGCVAAPADVLKRSLGPKPSASPESP